MLFECEVHKKAADHYKKKNKTPTNGDLKYFCDLSVKNGMEWEFLGMRALRDISYKLNFI